MTQSAHDKIAQLRFRTALRNAMQATGITPVELAAAIDCKPCLIVKALFYGLTPGASIFLPICRELHLDPLSFGFVHFAPVLEKRLKDGDANERNNRCRPK